MGFSCETILTVEPGYGDAFKEDQEEQGHPAGRVVVKQFEHIKSTLGAERKVVIFFVTQQSLRITVNLLPV